MNETLERDRALGIADDALDVREGIIERQILKRRCCRHICCCTVKNMFIPAEK